MSYSFDGLNDKLTGSFTSTYGEPITLACFVKYAAHPADTDNILCLGNSSSSLTDCHLLRTTVTDDNWRAASIDSTGTAANATVIGVNIDGVWAGLVGTFGSTTLRDMYVQSLSNHTNGTTSRTVADALQFISVGEGFSGGGDVDALIAEVAIWKSDLSDSDITSYLAGTPASSIDATNLIGYWPLSAESGTQSNLGTDAGGDLTVTGATYNADHPSITGGSFTIDVTKADLQPSPKSIPLDKGMPMTAASISPSASAITGILAMAVSTTALQPAPQAVALNWQQSGTSWVIDVAAATFTFQPYAVEGRRGIPVVSATPTIAGQTINLAYRHAYIESTQLTFATQDAVLEENHFFVRAAPTIAGQAIALHKGTPVISATPTLAPSDITLTIGGSTDYQIVSAALTFTPQDIGLQLNFSLAVDSTQLAPTSANLDLQWQKTDAVNVAEAHPVLTPGDIVMTQGIPVIAAIPAFAGQDVTFVYDQMVVVEPAEFEITSQDIDLDLTFTLGVTIVPAEFSIVGSDISAFLGSGRVDDARVEYHATEGYASFTVNQMTSSIDSESTRAAS
jgi:hypothetical protein